jgi:hypothetical protein
MERSSSVQAPVCNLAAMRTRTLLIVLVLSALVLTTTFAMRGGGHRKLGGWMASIHGR